MCFSASENWAPESEAPILAGSGTTARMFGAWLDITISASTQTMRS